MAKKFEFEYSGSEPGFCRTDFVRQVRTSKGRLHTNHYCILIPDGAHTSTDWNEPNCPLKQDILKNCYFQKVPDEDSMAKEVNAWIEENTGGLLDEDHKFTITNLT